MPVGDLAHHPQALGGVDVHAAGALQQRLDDDAGQLVGVLVREPLERLRPGGHAVAVGRRAVGEDLLGQHVAEHRVHPADRVAHAHAAERVAVVAAADREHAVPLGAAGAALVLERHLQRDLDAHRAGVGEEDVLEPVGGHLDQPLRASRSAGSWVSPPNITCANSEACFATAALSTGWL